MTEETSNPSEQQPEPTKSENQETEKKLSWKDKIALNSILKKNDKAIKKLQKEKDKQEKYREKIIKAMLNLAQIADIRDEETRKELDRRDLEVLTTPDLIQQWKDILTGTLEAYNLKKKEN